MGKVTPIRQARYSVGRLVQHKLFHYRGVIVDVDPDFQLSDEWYDAVAKSRPPRDKPWYHVLVDGAEHTTYVAERNLEPDDSARPVQHPMIDRFFSGFSNGRYVRDNRVN